jgi:uncharacterized metal-binding protein
MADGKTHSRAGVIFIGATSVLSTVYIRHAVNNEFALSLMAGSILGWLMPPDLDLPNRTHDEHRIMNLNPILGRLWVGFWASYGQVFGHRGISHWPIIGTLTRILWLFRHLILFVVFLALLETANYIDINVDFLNIEPNLYVLGGILIGWIGQDLVHLALDGILFGFGHTKATVYRGSKINIHKWLSTFFFAVIVIITIVQIINNNR